MLTKKCIRCGKKIVKGSNESMKYWKTKRFCSQHCALLGHTRNRGRKLTPEVKAKMYKFPKGNIPWNKSLTKKTDKRVALIGKKSGKSRFNKPKLAYRIIGGYKVIFNPKHPRSCKFSKCVPEQILIMEKHLGRFLKPQEVVHHINRDKLDNRLENLMLLPNKSAHMRLHHYNYLNSNISKGHQIGHPVRLESRKKISKSLKQYFKNNPNRHWTKRNN